jgi:hypothetical protein
MYKSLLLDIQTTNNWKEIPDMVWFSKKRSAQAKLKAKTPTIVCISPRSFSLPFARYFQDADIRHVFTDDFIGKKYPRFLALLASYVVRRGPGWRPLNFLAITASQSDAILHEQNDPHLALAPTTVNFHVVTRCCLCPYFCGRDLKVPMWTLANLPTPFRELVNIVQKPGSKVVLFMRFRGMYATQTHGVHHILDWMKQEHYITKRFWAHDGSAKRMGDEIAAFNAAKTGLLILDTRASLLRGHSIYASTLFYINTVSFHANSNCAREFAIFEQPPPLTAKETLQMIGRIRRPDTPFPELNVVIYEAAVCTMVPIALSATGKFTFNDMARKQIKFNKKYPIGSYQDGQRELKARIRVEHQQLNEKIDEYDPYSRQNRGHPEMLLMPRHPELQTWMTRQESLQHTESLIRRDGYPEYQCTKIYDHIQTLLPVGDRDLFKQIGPTHFRVQFL